MATVLTRRFSGCRAAQSRRSYRHCILLRRSRWRLADAYLPSACTRGRRTTRQFTARSRYHLYYGHFRGDGNNDSIFTTELQNQHDIVLLTTGATVLRDSPIDGRESVRTSPWIKRQTPKVCQIPIRYDGETTFPPKMKNVIVIGGGDTGTDCIGTSPRHAR